MNRYESYKPSDIDWVGQIPTHWETVQPKYKLNRVTRPIDDEDEVITCFRDGVVTLRKNRREDGFTNSIKEHGYQQIHPGDLVVHEMDGFAGAIGISDSKGKSTPVYTVVEPDDRTDLKYIAYLLREMSQTGKIESLARSIRERTTDFRWNMWSVIHFPFPPIEEQKLISRYLDKKTSQIDSLVEKIQKKIELLKEQRTSLIYHYVTKGLDPNVEMKDSGIEWIGEIPRHWEVKKLKHIVSNKGLIRGPFGGALKVDTFVPHGYKVYEQKNAIYNDFTLGTSFIDEEKFEELNRFSIIENDILMSCSGTIGKTALVPKDVEPGIINQALLIIRIQTALNILPEYIQTLFSSSFFQEQVIDNSQGGAMKNLVGIDIFRNVKIPLPNQTEQTNILKNIKFKCSVLDKRIDTELKRIELLKEYRQSLISSVVTGKVRVSEDMV